MYVFLKHTTKIIKMTCINLMVDLKPFKTIWKIKCQNNSTVETILFIFFKNVLGEKKN